MSKRIAERLNASMSPKIDEIFHGTPIDIRYKTVKFNNAQKIREIYRHAGIESSKADSPLILFKAGANGMAQGSAKQFSISFGARY